MPVYVGLLRAVNLGKGTSVGMEALRDLLGKAGLEDVQTVLQSGNVVFRSSVPTASELEGPLGEKISRSFRVRTELFVRSAPEWRTLVSKNPFSREAETDPSHLLAVLLRRAPSKERWEALDAAIRGRERVRGAGRHAYIVYPDGIGRSKLTMALVESKLGTPGTGRNWNTVLKLATLANGLERPVSRPP